MDEASVPKLFVASVARSASWQGIFHTCNKAMMAAINFAPRSSESSGRDEVVEELFHCNILVP